MGIKCLTIIDLQDKKDYNLVVKEIILEAI